MPSGASLFGLGAIGGGQFFRWAAAATGSKLQRHCEQLGNPSERRQLGIIHDELGESSPRCFVSKQPRPELVEEFGGE